MAYGKNDGKNVLFMSEGVCDATYHKARSIEEYLSACVMHFADLQHYIVDGKRLFFFTYHYMLQSDRQDLVSFYYKNLSMVIGIHNSSTKWLSLLVFPLHPFYAIAFSSHHLTEEK